MLGAGEPMEMRIAACTRKLTVGATLQVSLGGRDGKHAF
jgi:hypothetical protein